MPLRCFSALLPFLDAVLLGASPVLVGVAGAEDNKGNSLRTTTKGCAADDDSNGAVTPAITCLAPSVQELLLIDDLLHTMVGIEGKYIEVKKGIHPEGPLTFHVDPSMELSLQDLVKRVLPLCENYIAITRFMESRLHFRYGLVNHAFAAALRAILQDYYAMVAQLEHQFRLARLSLQGLWFFCQPMIGAMQVLSVVVEKAAKNNLFGAGILNLLESQAAAMAGDAATRALLQKLTQYASTPYLGILERWVYEGVIDDPYGEFFIDENKALQKESLSQDYNTTYWQQRYSLKRELPGFLASSAETILTTGKYLNAIRECGHSVQIPFSDSEKLAKSGTRHHLERINLAYSFASTELLNLITQKFDLLGRLRSLKHYFLLDQGDFLVHFMDIAKDELVKRPATISVEKLQSLLDLALRTSVASSDPYHEDLTCNVEEAPLVKQLNDLREISSLMTELNLSIENTEVLTDSDISSQTASIGITGFETFTVNYKVQWPLSLVISRRALIKYQVIFRLLFHCKHVERQLSGTWLVHQMTRCLDFKGSSVSESYVLCQRMMHFIQSFVHYLTFEVLEPNWHAMYNKLQNAISIDEVIQLHDFCLNTCMKQCLLLWPQIFEKIEKLKSICIQYATATQWLIPSMSLPDSRQQITTMSSQTEQSMRRRGWKGRQSRSQLLKVWKSSDESTFKTTLRRIREEFDKEIRNFKSFLMSGSQKEPHLAHLAHNLQDVENEL